jgi:hypothetical protein
LSLTTDGQSIVSGAMPIVSSGCAVSLIDSRLLSVAAVLDQIVHFANEQDEEPDERSRK